jgi:predicted small lipoprotein YifL
MTKTFPAAVAVIALAASIAGCGGEEGPPPAGKDASRAPAAPAGEVPPGVAAQYATVEEEVKAEGGETNSGPWTRLRHLRQREPAAPDAPTPGCGRSV